MPASAARIAANQRNAQLSTGPKTEAGKARSRENALKHGLTGAGVVLPNEDAAEVERRMAAFQEELQPTGEVGRALVRRAAVCSVRMDRGVSQETAALSERIRQAEADFVAPEGLDAAQVERLRAEAMARAMFDPSREAALARKYETAAERGFFRALKELRQLERPAKAADPASHLEAYRRELGSFLSIETIDADLDQIEARLDRRDAELGLSRGSKPTTAASELGLSRGSKPTTAASAPSRGMSAARATAPGGSFDLPFSIGRPR